MILSFKNESKFLAIPIFKKKKESKPVPQAVNFKRGLRITKDMCSHWDEILKLPPTDIEYIVLNAVLHVMSHKSLHTSSNESFKNRV